MSHYTASIVFSLHMQDEEAVQQLTERMKSMLGPFVLRRLKSDVASQLTAKQHKVEMVSMAESQAQLYKEAVQELKAQVAVSSKGAKQVVPMLRKSILCCRWCCV